MPIWNLSGHVMLPADLTGQLLTEQTEQAEFLLGLRDHTAGEFNAAQTADLKRALCLQVGMQAAQDPEAFLTESVDRGTESVSYREGLIVHPVAQQIVDEVLGNVDVGDGGSVGGFTIVRGFRDNR